MKTLPLITASLALSLAACGGGSSGTNSQTSSSLVASSIPVAVSSSPSSAAAASETSSSAASELPSSVASSAVISSVADISSSAISSAIATSSLSSSAASSAAVSELRPAKMEGFAAHAGVTGGEGGAVVTVSTGTQLNAALCARASKTTPIVILINGTINHGNTTAQGCNTQADVIEIKQMSNISIIGVGSSALFDEIGIHVRDASNIIIQNVHVRNVKKSGTPTSNGGDAIGMESDVDRVWVDHNKLEASGGEQDGYDSLLDLKDGVTNVTVSYNLFNDSSRAGLIGSSDTDAANTNITFHHNWYKNIEQRTPLIRHALVHVYNNYWSNPTQSYMFHAINSRMNAKVLVESNYFFNVNNPLIASDDSDVAGCWQTNNDNTVLPSIYYSRTVGNGALVVPTVVNGQLQSTCVVTVPYSVIMDNSADVPAIVMANAGVGIISTDTGTSTSSSSSAAVSSVANSSVVNSSVESSAATSSAAQVSSSSSASSVAVARTSLPLVEDFSAVDATGFFSSAYKALGSGDTPLYFKTGGTASVSNGELTMTGTRVTVGHRPPRTLTTALDTSANGDLDLSRPYRISFNVVASSGTGKVQVYIDNNTTGSANSMHGAGSRAFDAVASTLTAGQLIEISPTVGTATSFLSLRTESSASVTIDNLKLEYLP